MSKECVKKFEIYDEKECDYSSSFNEIIEEYKDFTENVTN